VSERPQAPRGTFDVLPEQSALRLEVESAARRILEAAGFRRIETPAFEDTDVFRRTVGEATDIVQKEMYTFADGGGRSLTLRPEVTAPIMRAYLEHGMHKLAQPVKLWYLSSCFRYERAQAGRYRQFWQIGAEAIGSDDPAVDAESILLLQALLDELGVRGARLRLASLGTADSRARYRELLQRHLRAHEQQLSDEVRGRIELNPLRAFDSDHPGTRAVMASAPVLLDHLDAQDAEHFAAVQELLRAAEVPFEIDPALVRGLDYYTRTVFEFTSDALGAQSGVGGGGRYDGLAAQLGGAPTPGMGWAAGVERMLLAAEERPVPEPVCDLYVALAGEAPELRAMAFALAAEARRAQVPAQLELAGRSLKGQMKQAGRLGARYVAILGDDGIALKDMESGEQETVASGSAVVARVLRGRHPG
jgi:histidyl-tRNA synthetase